ncbi:hypothetical protein E2C01_071934 [Portunus trituberculatus]|uniref:Uncharacterized protein n=1 Tax=Portunus trituberculatus TaxID=210409 RepID=A0A5B7HYC9_PORTR|nr:hypothetical protein [Portunus trituberculatus]
MVALIQRCLLTPGHNTCANNIATVPPRKEKSSKQLNSQPLTTWGINTRKDTGKRDHRQEFIMLANLTNAVRLNKRDHTCH